MTSKVKDIAKKLIIQSVYMSASQFAFHNNFNPLIGGQMLTGQFSINTSEAELAHQDIGDGEKRNYLRCSVQAAMRYLTEEPTEKQLLDEEFIATIIAAEISATYSILYSINPESDLSDEEVSEFSRRNAPYHAWTYWREYVQNTCNRMNLPVSTVPMLIIEQRPVLEKT